MKKSYVKKVLGIMTAVLLGISTLAGCGSNDKPEQKTDGEETKTETTDTKEETADSAGEKEADTSDSAMKKLGVICIDLNLPFYVEMMEAGTQAAEDYGVESIWKSAEGNIDNEIALIDSFIEQKVDCILVDPIDVVALEPAVQRAYDANIPVVTMGNVVDGPHNVNTIYPDHDNCYAIAKLACEMMGGEGELAFMVGAPGNYVSDMRQSGYEDAVKEYPDINYQILVSNYDAPTGLQKAQEVMASTPELKAFACVTDDVTMSAMQALNKEVLIFSHDGSDASIDYVKDGTFECTILTGSKRVGYWNVVIGAALANGEKVPKEVYLPTYWIVSDDAKKVIDEKGLAEGMSVISADEGKEKANGYRDEFKPGSYEVPTE